MSNNVVRFVRASLIVACVAALPIQRPVAPAAQEQQRPSFRTATNLVRVDAYPAKDGRILTGLGRDDFELLEDGVPQKIETFEYVEYPQNNPVEDKRDPNSQREGFQLAADPTYRVFVLYLDNLHVDVSGSHTIRAPLITFLNRVLGPRDLFGFLTTKQRPQDLMLGQQTLFIEEQLNRYWDWGQGGRVLDDDEDLMIAACFPANDGVAPQLIARRRMDEVFSDLEGVMRLLADVRQERKNLVLVSNGWPLLRRNPALRNAAQPRMPSVGVTNAGKLTLGRTGSPNEFDPRFCEDAVQRLGDMDFQARLQDMLRLARESNVTFYSIRPAGLAAPASVGELNYDRASTDSLLTLASNTDGLAVVNTNDLSAGVRRIADDLAGMYLLGYYPSNTKPDGRVRRITVRLKGSGDTVRARREYRAPSASDIEAMRAATEAGAAPVPAVTAVDTALGELKRLRPGAALHTRGSIVGDDLVLVTELTAPEVEAGRWKGGGELQVVLSGANGDVITTARGKLDPASRSATIRIPLNSAPGPFNATIRLRSDAEGTTQDGASIARRSGLFGDPLIFRLATPTLARPAGSVMFRRTERMRVQWPLTAAPATPAGRLLGRDGVPIELPVAVVVREEGAIRYLVADLNLAPLTAGEYVLEVSDGAGSTAHLAFRVSR